MRDSNGVTSVMATLALPLLVIICWQVFATTRFGSGDVLAG